MFRGWSCQPHMKLMSNCVRWRMRIRTALSCSQVIATADGTAMGTKGKDDDQLLREMEELMSVISTKERSENKRQSRRQTKVFPLQNIDAIFAACGTLINLNCVLLCLFIPG